VAANAFQSVGAGAHYLAGDSIHRNAGTTIIDAMLRAELRKKTTWPPIVFSNVVLAADTTLLPQAQRDMDAPDLGYHYDPIDYIPNYLAVTNCTLTIRNGTVLGYYDATGLWLQSGGAMDCEGTPLTPNRFVDYRTAQEQPVKLGPSSVGSGMPLNPARLTGGTPAPARLRFTAFSRMGRGSYSGYDLYALGTWSFSSLDVRDCVFQGGNVMLYSDAGSGVGPVTLVNNVFERQAFGLIGEPTLSLYNNLFKECPHVSFDVWGGTGVLRDNVFDSVLLDDWFDPPQTHSHNAYINVKDFYGNPARLYPPQATDKVLTNFLYATGPLGDYYQVSTNLLNAGSRTADLAGLYHFTTITNLVNGAQIKETNSVVDIGYHYVAVTEAGTPVDTDGDGLPDYFEDTNGNGAYDSSEDLGNFTSEDTDGDGLPDGWEWLHFGSFAPDDQSDYDGDGTSDLAEYLTGTDPNTITFRVAATNNFVSTAITTVQAAISGGMPFAQAVLVDNTNFAGAIWSSCLSTNVLVNLGTTEGWREVWIGLRGRQTTSEQTWQRKWLKLDSSPPPLIFTSPSTNTVSQPMLQLQGYCTEALSRLSCDVSNAAGVFTNQMILVLDQHYDRTARGFTTNTFQAFDLELTNGLNTVTVQAVDLAGNTATTNLSFTLVSDTNAPVIQLYWPQDGVRLSGDSFTWRGWVDDFTATLTATIVDGGGTTNEGNVLVERDGHFWAEDLPLGAGTNWLTLTAVDAWDNVAVTNIMVVKSDLTLAIDPVATEQLHEPSVTVSGGLSSSGYTVWVNGVKATDNGDGTWTADNVPLPEGGTAVLQARAIPNSDNGGNGTGGSGGSAASYNDPGNPDSAQAHDREAAPEKTEGIYVASDEDQVTWTGHYTWTDGFDWADIQQQMNHDDHWSALNGGIAITINIEDWASSLYGGGHQECQTVTTWPPSLVSPGYQVVAGQCDTFEGAWPVDPITFCPQHCEAHPPPRYDLWIGAYDIATLTQTQDKSARTTLKLRTGGKRVPGRQNLWVLTGGAAEVLNAWETYPCAPDVDKRAVDPSRETVIIGELGKLGGDGRLYVALPDGVEKDVTPLVKGLDYYTFSVSATKHKLAIAANGTSLDPDKAVVEFCVGQYVQFSPVWTPSEPPGIQVNLSVFSWNLEGNFVNESWQHHELIGEDWMPVGSINYRVNPGLLSAETTHAWWVSGGFDPPAQYFSKLGVHLTFNNGQQAVVTARGLISMHEPKMRIRNVMLGVLHGRSWGTVPPVLPVLQVKLGIFGGDGQGEAGNDCLQLDQEMLTRYPGKMAVTQLCRLDFSVLGFSFDDWRLDKSFPYVEWHTEPTSPSLWFSQTWDDTPEVLLGGRLKGEFKQYFQFLPDGSESIYVTVGTATWDVHGEITESTQIAENCAWCEWVVRTHTHSGQMTPSHEFPTWTNTR
jgi:hypothetical protein